VFYYFFVILVQKKKPDANRPFRVPGGLPALVALAAPTICIAGVAMFEDVVFACLDSSF
jgi:hypothetical protein